MVRGESVVIALFGAALGVLVGLGFGVALTSAVVASSGRRGLDPGHQPGGVRHAGLLFGIVAAVWPARRAARTNVISALSFE